MGTVVIGVMVLLGITGPVLSVRRGGGWNPGELGHKKWMLSGENIHLKMFAAVITDPNTSRKTPSTFG